MARFTPRAVKSFTIKREQWLSGAVLKANSKAHHGELESSLRDPETGLQCCLGFYCRAAGFKTKQITSEALLSTLWVSVSNSDQFAEVRESESMFAEVNDSPTITQHERERRIKKGFKNLGIKVVFQGSAKPAIAKALKLTK